MTIIIVIIVIAVSLYFLFWKKKADNKDITVTKENFSKEEVIEPEDFEEIIYRDENGEQYKLVEKTQEIPRRTYIKANLNGKYWGEIEQNLSESFEHSKFFDFNIYEVTLSNADYSRMPYNVEPDYKIPREKLPKLLNTILKKDGKEYEVNLHEPLFELGSIKFNRKLHQDEGYEVFGTIDAIVSGYILDFTKEIYYEKEYIIENDIHPNKVENEINTKTKIPTGNVEYKGNYTRTEYYYSDFKKTYWDDWKYKKAPTTNNEGCFSSLLGIILSIIGIAFLLMMLPQMAFILPFILILFLLNLIPKRFFNWLFGVIGILILIGFIMSLFQIYNNSNSTQTYIPKPRVTEKPAERVQEFKPILDTIDNKPINDTLIKHFRIWQDYDGKQYEGTIWTKVSDFKNAKSYKNNLELTQNADFAYDEMIFRLKEYDKNNLNGIYQLFDSIRQKEEFSQIKFAELIVSFVQDIPYSVVLPDDCNPNLYDDDFIREYLSSYDAQCDGFEKFGINSPVEFMSTLSGDCDTRTLLLYTILAHYGYDVALLSSEYYAHSLIGINLPINGAAYQYKDQRYVLWETTAQNTKAGILPNEISNLNYWRISLKSK